MHICGIGSPDAHAETPASANRGTAPGPTAPGNAFTGASFPKGPQARSGGGDLKVKHGLQIGRTPPISGHSARRVHFASPRRGRAQRDSHSDERLYQGPLGGDPGLAEVRVGENESFESALRRFNKKIQQSGILAEARRREHYEKPSVKRKRKEAKRKKATRSE